MKKYILVLMFLLILTGCKKESSSNEIKPTSIYDPTNGNTSEFLKESQNLGKLDIKSTDLPNPYDCKEIEYKVFVKINAIRKENNVPELKWDKDMYKPMQTRAKELQKKFDHSRPDGSSCFTVYSQLHGENIAKGYTSADKAVEGWMNSKGHKDNILNKSFKRTAIGYIKKGSDTYWCQGFGY